MVKQPHAGITGRRANTPTPHPRRRPQRSGSPRIESGSKRVQDRHGVALPQGGAFQRREFLGGFFNGVELADPRQRFRRFGRGGRPGLVKLAARMRPASDLGDAARVNPIVPAKRIGLQMAAIALQELLRSVAASVLGRIKDDVRKIAIADVHPDAAGFATARMILVELCHRRVVGVNHLRLQHE